MTLPNIAEFNVTTGASVTRAMTQAEFDAGKPYPLWLIGTDAKGFSFYKPPVAYPTDGKNYRWDEATWNATAAPSKTGWVLT